MRIEDLIDELDDMIEKAWSFPLSGGKIMINGERAREILEDLRLHLPQEVQQAKAVVADRAQIIGDAKREAEAMIRVSEERVKVMVNQNEIVKEAQAKANDLIEKAQEKSREVRKAANEYVDDLMKRTDEMLTENLSEVRKTRQSLKASQRTGIPQNNS